MSNWFPRKFRGFLIGLWATSPNVGNIIGVQLAALLLRGFDNRWYWLMLTISVLFLSFAVLIYSLLLPEPEKIGITINELSESEKFVLPTRDQTLDYSTVTINYCQADEDNNNSFASVRDDYNCINQIDEAKLKLLKHNNHNQRISFFRALILPRVFLYGATYFFMKLAVVSMMLWLPQFLQEKFNKSP